MDAKQRRGTSISLKMILTTTALIVLIVALFGAINALSTSTVYNEQIDLLTKTFNQSIEKRGKVQTKDLVQSSRTAILGSDFSTLQSFVPEVAKDDPEVKYAFVADKDGIVLAHTDKAQNGKPVGDKLAKELVSAAGPVEKRIENGDGCTFSRARSITRGRRSAAW
jgi:sensor histidine kinase regulating citrate/malate metabolism